MDAIKTCIYWVFLTIDGLALTIARVAYKVFYYTSKITLISGDEIERFTERVYLILGVALVFIVAYNLLLYIVDPDKLTDKTAGAGAFIKNVLISLTIVVITPMAFVKLYSLQNIIIEQGIIANIIMGTASPTDENAPQECTPQGDEEFDAQKCSAAVLDQGANNAVASVFSAFVIPSGGYVAADCEKDELVEGSDKETYCQAYFILRDEGTIHDYGDWKGMESIILDECTEDNPKYEYYIIFSTAGLAAMIFFFISYCLELGKRAGKLAILQLLAPIPVLMEIVPGKSGSRKKWLDMTISTYLDVFIYQITIFIVIYMITFVPSAISRLFGTLTFRLGQDFLARNFSFIIVVFGLLKFGKEVPKLIEDLLPFKGSGSLGNAFKNFKTIGGATAFAGGLVGGTVGRAVRNIRNTDKNWNGFWNSANTLRKIGGSVIGGVGSGLGRSLRHINEVDSWKDANNLRRQVNERVATRKAQRDEYARAHPARFGSIKGHASERWEDMQKSWGNFTGSGFNTNTQDELKTYKSIEDVLKGFKINTKDDKEYNEYTKKYNERLTQAGISPGNFKEQYDSWKKAEIAAGNTNTSLSDFLNNGAALHSRFGAKAAYLYRLKDDILQQDEFMDQRKRALKISDKDKMITGLASLKAMAKNDIKIDKIIKDAGLDLNDLQTRITNGSITNDEIVGIYDQLFKEFGDKTIKNKVRDLTAQYEDERIAAEMKASGKKSSGGGK